MAAPRLFTQTRKHRGQVLQSHISRISHNGSDDQGCETWNTANFKEWLPAIAIAFSAEDPPALPPAASDVHAQTGPSSNDPTC